MAKGSEDMDEKSKSGRPKADFKRDEKMDTPKLYSLGDSITLRAAVVFGSGFLMGPLACALPEAAPEEA
jgi:hypothetical protein